MKTAAILLVAAMLVSRISHAGEPWKMHAIDPADPAAHLAGADGIRLGDVNGDGWLDMVTGWEEGESVRICLHPGPEKSKAPWPAVTVGRVKSPEDAVFADLDGDGRLDVVSATEGKSRTLYVHWSPASLDEITDEAKWETGAFPAVGNPQWWMYTLPFDVDRDGDTDLLAASKNVGASVTWFRNPGGAEARDLAKWEQSRLCDAGWIMSLRLFESGGRQFLLFSDRKGAHPGIYLMPLLDETPWTGEPVRIGASGEEVMFLDIAHLDGDERVDVIAAIRPDAVRIFHQPGKPLAAWETVTPLAPVPGDIYGTVKAVRVGDLDGDGEADVAITCERADGKKIGVFRTSGALNGAAYLPVSDATGIKYDRIELMDLDADGDLDIVTCEERAGLGVIWFENPSR